MPAYNAQKYIRAAIESILHQTFTDFVVIVNDASTDSTPEIIREYSAKDSRIVVVNNTNNLYIAGALNAGIAAASSDLIARMDADDIAEPSRLERQLAVMKSQTDVGVVGSNIEIINEAGESIGLREYPEEDRGLKAVMFRYSPFAHPAVMLRKKCWQEFGGYDGSKYPSEDVDFWFKIGTKYEFVSVPEPLLKYRFFTNSHSNSKLKFVEMLTIRMRLHAFFKLGYRPGIFDVIYNLAQISTAFLMPASMRVKLFNLLRNKSK